MASFRRRTGASEWRSSRTEGPRGGRASAFSDLRPGLRQNPGRFCVVRPQPNWGSAHLTTSRAHSGGSALPAEPGPGRRSCAERHGRPGILRSFRNGGRKLRERGVGRPGWPVAGLSQPRVCSGEWIPSYSKRYSEAAATQFPPVCERSNAPHEYQAEGGSAWRSGRVRVLVVSQAGVGG